MAFYRLVYSRNIFLRGLQILARVTVIPVDKGLNIIFDVTRYTAFKNRNKIFIAKAPNFEIVEIVLYV